MWVCVGSYVLRMVGFVDFSNVVFPIVDVDVWFFDRRVVSSSASVYVVGFVSSCMRVEAGLVKTCGF